MRMRDLGRTVKRSWSVELFSWPFHCLYDQNVRVVSVIALEHVFIEIKTDLKLQIRSY